MENKGCLRLFNLRKENNKLYCEMCGLDGFNCKVCKNNNQQRERKMKKWD